MPALALAENETDAREYLSRQLSSDGFEVYAAASGREVLELAERAGPDLVLVESALPDGSGRGHDCRARLIERTSRTSRPAGK